METEPLSLSLPSDTGEGISKVSLVGSDLGI